jgi:hypothetical protein
MNPRLIRLANTPAWRSHLSTEQQLAYFGLTVPERWNAKSFILHGKSLMLAIHRMARLAQRKAIPHVAANIAAQLNKQTEATIRYVQHRRPQKSGFGFSIGDNELWMQAISEVFGQKIELILEIVPPIQSVGSQAYSKVSAALGQQPRQETATIIHRNTQEIAQRISKINETTRERIANIVRQSLEKGSTVPETTQILRDKMPELNANRAMTIARTELNNQWTRNSALAYMESETVTHVSILGCEAEEPTSPQYNGRSTCNYPDLPVTDLPAFLEVGFHPNHSGSICPSGFRS